MSEPESHPAYRPMDQLSDGWSDQLKPLEAIDVHKTGTFAEMLAAMSRTAFGGRGLGEAAEVLHEMATDEKCLVVGTFSGAMTIAKQGLLITEMLDQGMLDAIVSTGALMCHGLIEQSGRTHSRHDPHWSDEQLYDAGYCRVYDTLELERNLEEAADLLQSVLRECPVDHPLGSHEINWRIGEHVLRKSPGRGILQSAAQRRVPVYVPAFSDSELGIDLLVHNQIQSAAGRPPVRLDPLRDLEDYLERALAAERLGIFTIGGGVPRNWAQQVGPLAECVERRTGRKHGRIIRFHYAVRICPEPVHWGGLSGCTYSEGVSWGKFVSRQEGGRQAEVYADATIVWPILLRGVLERMGRL